MKYKGFWRIRELQKIDMAKNNRLVTRFNLIRNCKLRKNNTYFHIVT